MVGVLIADDEHVLRRLIRRVLEGTGLRVSEVEDGRQAASLLRAKPGQFEVALLDVALPPDGAAPLLEQIHNGDERIGVVLISGAPLAPALGETLAAMGGEFLQKPFDPDVLVEAVKSCIPSRET